MAYLKPNLLRWLIMYSIPEQWGDNRRMLIGKRVFDKHDKTARAFRLLHKYGLMNKEDRLDGFLYSISPKGAAFADSIKLRLASPRQ